MLRSSPAASNRGGPFTHSLTPFPYWFQGELVDLRGHLTASLRFAASHHTLERTNHFGFAATRLAAASRCGSARFFRAVGPRVKDQVVQKLNEVERN